MKNLAKLALFLSVSFIGLLIISALVHLLHHWSGWALRFSPAVGSGFSGTVAEYLRSSLPAALYLSTLFSLTYAARLRVFYPAAFLVILVFVLALSGAGFFGLQGLETTGFSPVLDSSPKEPAKPGFIAGTAADRNRTIFLEDPYKADGAVVRVIEGQELRYERAASPQAPSRLPFFAETRGVFDSIGNDFESGSRVLSRCFEQGLVFYAVYAGSLAALLLSLGCLCNISFWPLANLFFGALLFRGVLALESFLNQRNINDMLASLVGKLLPSSLISPVIFCALAALILLYSGLVYLARGRISDG